MTATGAAGDRIERLAAEVPWDEALPPRAASRAWRAQQAIKRGLDVLLAAVGLVVLAPILCLIALIVWLDSDGPVLYPWRVVGYRGRRFTGYKFRTMVPEADRLKADLMHLNEMSGPVFKIREDPRVTRVGRILRKYSLDELPQLWSVLRGDMSLVGPRPLGPDEFVSALPQQRRKLAVVPGITCLWQVNGRSEIDDFEHWVALDLQYISTWSLGLDFRILAQTIPVVFRGTGAY
jgi:lipopolysaccharide/colanic/teichoic acid biosynthesis glycosyltransferase